MGIDRLAEQVEKEDRDLTVLLAVMEHGPIGISRLAEVTDVPEHKVRYSLRMLENDDRVEPTPDGSVPADDVEDRVDNLNEGVDHLVSRLEGLKAILGDESGD